MKLEYKEMSVHEVLRLFQKGETITMNQLTAKGAPKKSVYMALWTGWIEECEKERGIDETFQLTEVGYRARGI